MTEQLGIGAVGIGGIWSACHAPAWEKCPDAKVVAVCDINRDKAQRYADVKGVHQVSSDFHELLRLPEVDAVDICTSNKFHSEIAVAALEAGKHVICEKPDAINPTEAQRMADAANASGKTLMTMRNNRFSPGGQFLRGYIDTGALGEVYAARCGWIRRRGIPGKGGWFTTKELSGGGPLIDLGVHMIDLALWLMGNPVPVSVSGATYCKFANDNAANDSVHSVFGEAKADGVFDVEDLAMGFVRFANGASLQIEFSWASNISQETRFVELRGTKAGASFRDGDAEVYIEGPNGTQCDLKPRTSGGIQEHAGFIYHFVDVIKGKAKPTIVPADGVHMIKILSAIYESAKTGREVRLD